MRTNPYQDTPERAERRRDVVFVAGLILAALGLWGFVSSVFDPVEYCNAFRCEKEYNVGAIVGCVGVFTLGVWWVWMTRKRR